MSSGYDILKSDRLCPENTFHITGRTQYINVKNFGNLINHVLPVKIKGDGVVHIMGRGYM